VRTPSGPAEDVQLNLVKCIRDGRRQSAHGAYSISEFRKQQPSFEDDDGD
jgi:hypothetical protein